MSSSVQKVRLTQKYHFGQHPFYGHPIRTRRCCKKLSGSKTEISDITGGGGGGLTQKCRTCMGWGCFRDPKHKSNMYTFVQQRGCPYFIPNHKSINGTFVHTFHNKIIKNYEKMTNFHSFCTNFYIFFNELLL